MADKEYNIDELLAELRVMRSEMEGGKTEEPEQNKPDSGLENFDKEIEAFLHPVKEEKTEEFSKEETEPEQTASEETAESENTEETVTVEPEETVKDNLAATIEANISEVRNIRRQLTETMELNRAALTGGFKIGHTIEVKNDDVAMENQNTSKRDALESHPIFTSPVSEPNFIPSSEPVKGENTVPVTKEVSFAPADNSDATGVLNLASTAEEDDFSEFFGDTVVVEREHSKKKDKVRSIVNASDTEDDDSTPAERIKKRKQTTSVRMVLVGAAALAAAALNVLLHDNFEFADGRVYYGINAALCLLVILLNGKLIVDALLGLFTGKPRAYSLVSVSLAVSMAQCIIHMLNDTQNGAMACVVSLSCAFCADLAEYLDASRNSSSYDKVQAIPRKYASLMVQDTGLAKALCRDLGVADENVLIKKRCGRVEDGCFTPVNDTRFRRSYLLQYIGVASVIAVSALNTADGLMGVADTAATAASMCAPFAMGLTAVLPLWKNQKELSRYSAVLPGYPEAEELDSCTGIVLEGKELFPRDKVLLHGIKTFERERVDNAILYAASVLIHSCDTMSHMFMKVIQGKTDILYDADSIVYEEGLGFSFWVNQNRVLVGSRELLEAHEISVPSRDYENRYTKTSTRDAIYLAVSGKLYAMFVISYQPDESVASILQKLVRQNRCIIVRTRDFILSADKISKMYDIPRAMVTVVRDGNMQDLARETDYAAASSSLLTSVGSAGSFARGLISSGKLISAATLSGTLCSAVLIISAVLTLTLGIMGSLSSTPVVSVLAFQCIWFTIHWLAVILKKM